MINVESASHFDFLSREYRELFARSRAMAFQHPIWLDRMFAHFVGSSSAKPLILVGRSEEGRLRLLLPLLARSWGPFVLIESADFGVCDYNSLVADEDTLALLVSADGAELRMAIRKALPRFFLGRIRLVRGDDKALIEALAPCRATFLGYHAHEASIDVPLQSWRSKILRESFARSLAAKRKSLARNGKLTLEQVLTSDEVLNAFQIMRADRDLRFENDVFRDAQKFAFYLDVAQQGLAEGLARTHVLKLDDVPIAVVFSIANARRFMGLLIGFSARFKNYSPGFLIMESLVEDCINRGDAVFDLTVGDESYKANFHPKRTPMLAIWFGNPAATFIADHALSFFITAKKTLKHSPAFDWLKSLPVVRGNMRKRT